MNNEEFKKYINQPKFQKIISDKKLRKELLSKKYRKYRAWIFETSDLIIKNKLIFNHKWDMERTHEPFDYKERIDWNHTPNNDDEFIYMKNRHRIWNILGQAYYISKNEKYILAWKKQFVSWIEQDYPNTGLESKLNRLIDKGIRMENWVKFILLVNDSNNFDYKIFNIMMKEIKREGSDLNEKYPAEQILSNHGLIQNQGLLQLEYYFGDILKLNNKELLKKRVEDNARIQILPDGIHWEQSPMYHAWVLYSFLQIKKYCSLLKIKLSKEYNFMTEKLAIGMIKFIKPNGHQPKQNDSDDTNVRDMISRAALVFKNGVLKSAGLKSLDFDTAIEYGSQGIKNYEKIRKGKIPFESIACESSGNYYLRSSWRKDANYLSFRNGQYGSGHSHCDPNHFTVFANGVNWITNTGRYTYRESKDRIMFKSAQYHNTQIINSLGATRAKDAWSFESIAKTIKLKPIINNKFDYVGGTNLGFIFDRKPVMPFREIIFIKPGYWFMWDTFYSSHKNQYELRMHIPEYIKIDINKGNCKIRLIKNKKCFDIYNLSNTDIKISKGKISNHYNQIEDSQVISQNILGPKITNIFNILDANNSIINIEKVIVKKAKGVIAQDDEVNAWKILRKNNEYEIIVVANKEIIKGKKIYIVQGVSFYGKKAILWFKNKSFNKISIIEY